MDLPDEVVSHVKRILENRQPTGIDIGQIGKEYFAVHKTLLYPERYGLKTWGDVLTHVKIKPFCEIFNGGVSARLRTGVPPPSSTPPSISTTPRSGTQTPTSSVGSNGPSASRQGTPFSGISSRSGSASTVEKKINARSGGDTSSQLSGSSLGKRSGSTADRSAKKKATGYTQSQSQSESEAETDISDVTHVTISPHNKAKLSRDRTKIVWIPREGMYQISFSTYILERRLGPEQPAMYIDCTYCDRQVLENLMDVKAHIKRVNADKFAEIRNRHNEFEFQKGAIFQHGAAIKMANIDALMGYALTSPKSPDGSNLVGPNELLYFADVYGGPGGYAEYVLWKKKWQAKGFGITHRGQNDYNLAQAEHFPRESFEPFYGESGTEGQGDISRPYNLSKFIQFVKKSTDEKGVHFMIASGGDRNDYVDEDQKEIRCKYIFLSELLLALSIVRQGGHYVSRIYDMYTPFTVGLIYLMYRCFDQVAIFKPESSLPASAERYIICKWRKPDGHIREISNYLSECHKVDWLTKRNRRASNEEPADIIDLVSRDRLRESFRFCDYICRTNAELGRRQYEETSTLARSIVYNNEQKYVDERLREIQDKCLELWGIPTRTREKPKYAKATTPTIRAMKLVTPYAHDFFTQTEREGQMDLTKGTLKSDLKQPKEWRFMAVGRERGFFLCLGGTSVYQFGGAVWSDVSDTIELMNNTLVYADLVDEIETKGATQSIATGFHIIDAMVLGGKDVRHLPYDERFDLITKFARSINKESRDDLANIRAKQHHEMKSFPKFLSKVRENERVRNREGSAASQYLCPVDIDRPEWLQFHPGGVLLVKTLKEGFASADFRFSMQNRLFWRWTESVDIKLPSNIRQILNENGNGNGEQNMEIEDDKDYIGNVDAIDIVRQLNE